MNRKEFINLLKYFGFTSNKDEALWRKGGVWIHTMPGYWYMDKPETWDLQAYEDTDGNLVTAKLRKMIPA